MFKQKAVEEEAVAAAVVAVAAVVVVERLIWKNKILTDAEDLGALIFRIC